MAEAGEVRFRRWLVQIDVDPPTAVDKKPPQIVDSMGVIGMFVGEEHRVEPVHVRVEKLLAQIRRGVNQDPGDASSIAPFNQERRAPAAVPGIARIAGAPAECGPRNATRGARAKNREVRRHAARAQARAGCLSSFTPAVFRNRRKKFSLVCRAIASSDMPRASATTVAVSTI